MEKIPDVVYYSQPEKQSLRDKICNEIQVAFFESDELLTPEQVTQNINDRLGDEYTVEQVKAQVGKWGSSIRIWDTYMVLIEMISSNTTEYRAHLSKSNKWKRKWK